MTIKATSTLTDVCFAVCTALDSVGTTAVLSGGSAATYYAPSRYQSRDADFVLTIVRDRERGEAALASIGFYPGKDRQYRHAESTYTLDFLSGPLAVGADVITSFETVERGQEILHVLSRTDAVRDRLVAFFHWSDRSALVTALAVAASGEIDLQKIRAWSRREGAFERFREFHNRLST